MTCSFADEASPARSAARGQFPRPARPEATQLTVGHSCSQRRVNPSPCSSTPTVTRRLVACRGRRGDRVVARPQAAGRGTRRRAAHSRGAPRAARGTLGAGRRCARGSVRGNLHRWPRGRTARRARGLRPTTRQVIDLVAASKRILRASGRRWLELGTEIKTQEKILAHSASRPPDLVAAFGIGADVAAEISSSQAKSPSTSAPRPGSSDSAASLRSRPRRERPDPLRVWDARSTCCEPDP